MKLSDFIKESYYINYSSENIILKSNKLFKGIKNIEDKINIAFEFVRDEHQMFLDIKQVFAMQNPIF